MDDVSPDRQCRDELCPLQRFGLIRQSFEAAVDAAFPIVSRLLADAGGEATQVAQGQRKQPSGP